MQPDNAIIGDVSGIDLPEAPKDIVDLTEERSMAKYSKTKEFKRLKGFLEGRIEFFEKYFPNGRAIADVEGMDSKTIALNWKVANAIIGEFKLVLDEYDRISGVVDESDRNRGV